jgi:glycosyltransferase involved in cell wall biosynthesis
MLVGGLAGRIVPADDPITMADAVAQLIEDPARALLMVRRAKAEVERYTWPQIHQDWAAVYQRGSI